MQYWVDVNRKQNREHPVQIMDLLRFNFNIQIYLLKKKSVRPFYKHTVPKTNAGALSWCMNKQCRAVGAEVQSWDTAPTGYWLWGREIIYSQICPDRPKPKMTLTVGARFLLQFHPESALGHLCFRSFYWGAGVDNQELGFKRWAWSKPKLPHKVQTHLTSQPI